MQGVYSPLSVSDREKEHVSTVSSSRWEHSVKDAEENRAAGAEGDTSAGKALNLMKGRHLQSMVLKGSSGLACNAAVVTGEC